MSGSKLETTEVLGLYGKLPVFGDFVTRNLQHEFVQKWDEWLQVSIAHSRQELGPNWLDSYLVAPIWRFVVGPGILGSNAWIGVVAPSVDKVGRYFPLTLAFPISADVDIVETYLGNNEWFQNMEILARDALNPNLDFSEFEVKLGGCAPPVCEIDIGIGENTIPTLQSIFISTFFCMPSYEGIEDCISQVRKMISESLQPVSLWGAKYGDNHEHMLSVTDQLPEKERFCALLDLKFEAHDWINASKQNLSNQNLEETSDNTQTSVDD